jgi:peptidoglycan/LPS O-acetylase OafA/YrhL
VISGFLITSLILRDLDAGEFRLMEFWARRVRRILPALTVCLLVTLVAGSLLLLPKDLLELAKSGVAQSLF